MSPAEKKRVEGIVTDLENALSTLSVTARADLYDEVLARFYAHCPGAFVTIADRLEVNFPFENDTHH